MLIDVWLVGRGLAVELCLFDHSVVILSVCDHWLAILAIVRQLQSLVDGLFCFGVGCGRGDGFEDNL